MIKERHYFIGVSNSFDLKQSYHNFFTENINDRF